MIPSKSKRSESRRSSILKPRKPRQPLQNVNFDSSSNENSPAASKVKRRVSFAEKKHVKEFCHSTEQGTVWDNTYEEHDFSLKGSSVADQNAQVELKENVLLCPSNNDCIHIHSENNSCSNNAYLVNDQFAQESVATTNEKDDDTNCELDFTNPVKSTELSNISQLGYAALANKSYVFEDQAVSSGIVAYSDTDEESPDKESQARQTVMTNISQTSKNVKSSSITIYRDEEDYADNVANKCYSKTCPNNVNTELDEAHVQDLSMELTAPIPAFLSSSYAEEQKKQKRNNINNLDTNYTTNCNNVSMEITEAIPISAKSIASNLGITEQVPTILQNCENTKLDAANTHNTTAMNCANDSMVLTSVIQPFADATGIGGICCTSNTAFDTSMGISSAPFEMYEKNVCDENIIQRKDQTDKTEIFNDVLMEMTKPVGTILFSSVYNKENFNMDEPISRDDRTMFFHNVSMEMTKTVSTKNKQEIANTNTGKSLSEENAHGEEDANTSICFNEGTKILFKSMELTEAVPASLHYEKIFRATHVERSSLNKSTCEEYENDASMEITKSVNSKNGKALTVQDINHCREIEVTDEDQVDEREHTQKRINEEANLQNPLNIEKREQYSDNKRQEKCSDHLEGTGAVIEDSEEDSEEGRKNLNDQVKQQCMEQKDECATKKLVTAQCNTIEDVENGSLTEQNPFLTLSQKLETHAVREDCIWNVYYKNIDRKMIVFGFMSNSLLITAFLSHDFNDSEENLIKEIKIISRVSDDSGILIRIVHKLILEKINAEILTKLYKTHQDILPMLNFISQDVKLAMDFMFDLRRLDDLNLMEITYDEISFVSRSKRMDIILRVTIKVKQFDKLTSNDISLHCLLGRIKVTDIKNLIKNVKRDHKFLRRYMNDVKDYIDIIEETQII